MFLRTICSATIELARDIRFAVRSLLHVKGLAATVIVTLGLGIGANAAIFSVVRGVLLRPLVNRDENRLIYIHQAAPGIGVENYTFSVPEIDDFKNRATTISAFGDFSTVDLALIVPSGGEPRMVKAGVVNGSFFDVMGLRPVIGRLLTPQDDGPKAAGVAVLTYRFWKTAFNGDPTIVGKDVRLGVGTATIVGVLEPSVPYPTETEIMANMVTSPHHLGATMNTSRTHRMTDLFGRLKPGVSFDAARAELTALHSAMIHEHPGDYSKRANVQLRVAKLRDQIAAPARTILLVLLSVAGVVFIIACSNVANLILARSVRREGELALRTALGASRAVLRRTLLAESLVLCTAGAVAGLYLADPLVTLMSRYAARFSIRALDVTVDSTVAWVGAGLAMAAAVLLAFVPRLPSSQASAGLGLGGGTLRITPATNRRLRIFATMQIAFSFVLLAGAAMLIGTLVTLQTERTGYDLQRVLAFDVPNAAPGVSATRGGMKMLSFNDEALRRIGQVPGVDAVAAGSNVPWRDNSNNGPNLNFSFMAEGYTPADGEEPPRAQFRFISGGFFSVLGVQLVAGREFTSADRRGAEPVAVVSQSLAQRFFPNGEALNRHLMSTASPPVPLGRIVGVVADVDDEHIAAQPTVTIYQPIQQNGFAGRLFVRTAADPHTLVPIVTRTIREIAPDQPVERAATLEEVRTERLSPDRVNALVFSGFAGIALLIAVVGISGVLAFSVSARTREFGMRLAVGCSPRALLTHVLSQGTTIAVIGIGSGAIGGFLVSRVATKFFTSVQLPGPLTVAAAAAVLLAAALVASWLPAARASRIDVIEALRSE
jgi:putative ABC transport system permease protein